LGYLYIYRGFGVTKWLCKSRIFVDLQLVAMWVRIYGSFRICGAVLVAHLGAAYPRFIFLEPWVVSRYLRSRVISRYSKWFYPEIWGSLDVLHPVEF